MVGESSVVCCVFRMSVSARDARAKVITCTALNDKQQAKMLMPINTEPEKTLPVFTEVPERLPGVALSAYLEGMTAGALSFCTQQYMLDYSICQAFL